MSNNYCTTKGLGWAFPILFFLSVFPVLMLMMMVGLDEYALYCNSIISPALV